jgi:hypothetical protein
MSYPEKGASYRNKPAWMDRAVAGEKHAQGGPVEYSDPDSEPEERKPYDLGPPIDHHGHDQPGYSEGSKGAVMQAIREGGDRSENNRGNGPRKDAAFTQPRTESVRERIGRGLGQSIGFKRGGSTC